MTAVQNNEMSARQRGRMSRSGAEASAAMRGAPRASAEEEQEKPRRAARKDSSFANPTEFLAGPQKPGKIVHGVRRYESAEADSVGYMLTDEFLMSGAGEKHKVEVPKHARAHVTNACAPTENEPPFRPTVNMDRTPAGGLDAPYFEDNDPKAPRDADPVSSKRHVNPNYPKEKIFLAPGQTDCNFDYSGQNQTWHKNKANESVNVTNLGIYSPEQLREAKPSHRQNGAPKFIAPDMPPRRRPVLHQVKSAAKDEHDVLGTGRWGRPEEEKPVGKASGACKPPKDNNIFAAAPRQEASAAAPSRATNLLRYYDPKTDGPVACDKTSRPNRSNVESKYQEPPRTGKGKGQFSHQSKSNIW